MKARSLSVSTAGTSWVEYKYKGNKVNHSISVITILLMEEELEFVFIYVFVLTKIKNIK